MTIVYSLASSRDEEVRYIGQTVQPMNTRMRQHFCDAKRLRRTATQRWIMRELDAGFKIVATVIVTDAVLHETEIGVIAQYRASGARLLNHTDGGEGTIGWSGNAGKKRPDLAERNRLSKGLPGRPSTPETNSKISAAHRGRKKPYMAERNRAQTGLPGHAHTDQSKAKIRAALTGRSMSAETKQKIADKAKGRRLSIEGIAKLREGYRRYQEARQ